jgi:hypothetical protein
MQFNCQLLSMSPSKNWMQLIALKNGKNLHLTDYRTFMRRFELFEEAFTEFDPP